MYPIRQQVLTQTPFHAEGFYGDGASLLPRYSHTADQQATKVTTSAKKCHAPLQKDTSAMLNLCSPDKQTKNIAALGRIRESSSYTDKEVLEEILSAIRHETSFSIEDLTGDIVFDKVNFSNNDSFTVQERMFSKMIKDLGALENKNARQLLPAMASVIDWALKNKRSSTEIIQIAEVFHRMLKRLSGDNTNMLNQASI